MYTYYIDAVTKALQAKAQTCCGGNAIQHDRNVSKSPSRRVMRLNISWSQILFITAAAACAHAGRPLSFHLHIHLTWLYLYDITRRRGCPHSLMTRLSASRRPGRR